MDVVVCPPCCSAPTQRNCLENGSSIHKYLLQPTSQDKILRARAGEVLTHTTVPLQKLQVGACKRRRQSFTVRRNALPGGVRCRATSAGWQGDGSRTEARPHTGVRFWLVHEPAFRVDKRAICSLDFLLDDGSFSHRIPVIYKQKIIYR